MKNKTQRQNSPLLVLVKNQDKTSLKRTSLMLLILSMLLVLSCKKEQPSQPASTQSNQNNQTLDDYLNRNAVPIQSFQLNAEDGGSFSGSKGSVITIPENSFVSQTGQTISGGVDLKFMEIFSTSDIIFSEVFPLSNITFLNSGGEYYLSAEQNGESLSVAPGKMINVEIPAQAVDSGMQLFFANGDEDGINLEVGWQVANNAGPIAGGATASDFTFNSADDSYSINLDSLGWGNIDKFLYGVSYFDCSFELNGLSNLDYTNTTAYAVFKDENTVWPLGTNGWGSINNNLISDSHLAAIEMNILVISVVGGQLYYGLLDVTPAANQTYSINMVDVDSDDLDAIINSLP